MFLPHPIQCQEKSMTTSVFLLVTLTSRPTVILAERGVMNKAQEELKALTELDKQQAGKNGSQQGG